MCKQSLKLLFLFFCLLAAPLLGENNPFQISFKGYLGKDELSQSAKTLETINSNVLILQINSTSGDLQEVFNIAKQIYQAKIEKHLHVIVYIEDNAIGSAAILPFLADEL